MIEGNIYSVVIPLGRSVAGFIVGVILGIFGGWMALNFNQLIGYPWHLELHRHIYLVSIGVGAGVGAYVGWANLNIRWPFIAGSVLLVLAGAIAGVYLGMIYGQYTDETYLGRRYTIVNSIHYGAPIGGIAISTLLGLFSEFRTKGA